MHQACPVTKNRNSYLLPTKTYSMSMPLPALQGMSKAELSGLQPEPAKIVWNGPKFNWWHRLVFHQKYLAKVKPEDRALVHVLWQGSFQHSANSPHACCRRAQELTLQQMFWTKCSWSLQHGGVPAATLVDSPESFWGLLRSRVPDDVEIAGCFE